MSYWDCAVQVTLIWPPCSGLRPGFMKTANLLSKVSVRLSRSDGVMECLLDVHQR